MFKAIFLRSVLGRATARKEVTVQVASGGSAYRFLAKMDRSRRREEGLAFLVDYVWPLGGASTCMTYVRNGLDGRTFYLKDLVYDAQDTFQDMKINSVSVYVPKKELGLWQVRMDRTEYEKVQELVKVPTRLSDTSTLRE